MIWVSMMWDMILASNLPTSDPLVAIHSFSSHGSGRRISWATIIVLCPNMVA